MHAYVLFSLVGLAVQSLKVIAHGVRWKINTTSRCVDHVYTLSPKLSSVKKKNWIRFDFLRFRIRSKHFDRKWWRIQKYGKRIQKFRTQCARTLTLNVKSLSLVWENKRATYSINKQIHTQKYMKYAFAKIYIKIYFLPIYFVAIFCVFLKIYLKIEILLKHLKINFSLHIFQSKKIH